MMYTKLRVLWVAPAFVACCLPSLTAQSQDRNWSREICYGQFVPFVYNYYPLSTQQAYPGTQDRSSQCTIGGRTGHASVGPGIFDGDISVYTWVCDEGGGNCGQDRPLDEINVQCFGETRTRDGESGTPSDDGELVYTSREPSIGAETRPAPMDENGVYAPQIQQVRVTCWYTKPL